MRSRPRKGKRKDSKPAPTFDVIAEHEAYAGLQTEVALLDRAHSLEENLEDGLSDADSTWFIRHLTEKQRGYGIAYMQSGGDWRKASQRAGYSRTTPQRDIENGDAMIAFMKAVRAEMAAVAGITTTQVLSRLNRIALRAEKTGDAGNAIRANVKLGEALGMFENKGVSIQVNGDGTTIVIGSARNRSDDEAYLDAEFSEIADMNGLSLPEPGQ